MDKNEFFKKYKDPRWQKKRLEILQRDEFECQRCGDSESTLHIHHFYYEKDKNPWEYHNEALITLCESCHEHEGNARQDYEQMLLHTLKKTGFLSDDIFTLMEGFFNFKLYHTSEVVAASLRWFLSSEEFQKKTIDDYFKNGIMDEIKSKYLEENKK